jgi:hypothetical protein
MIQYQEETICPHIFKNCFAQRAGHEYAVERGSERNDDLGTTMLVKIQDPDRGELLCLIRSLSVLVDVCTC